MSEQTKAPNTLENDRRIGSHGVWRKIKEGFDADGNRVVVARLEGDIDEADFAKHEWAQMPKYPKGFNRVQNH